MPTTTNFGWTTPADTDYVKDGALAIRTLANGIDTSLVDLKGGTTGQILSKNSNTDLDYTWINNDQGDITGVTASAPLTGGGTSGAITVGIQDGTTAQKGAVQLENSTSSTSTTTAAVPASVKSAYDLANAAIPKSLVDAAGDIIYATANDTVARLALGTAGQVLTVNSGATAPEWKAATSGGYTLLETLTLSGSSTTSATIAGTYKHLFIEVKDVYLSGNDTLALRLNTASTGYYFHQIRIDATTVSADNPANFSAFQLVDLGNNSSAVQNGYGTIFIPRYTDTSSVVEIQSTMKGYIAGNMRSMITWGFYDNSAAITSVRFISGTATMTQGTAYIYGVS